MKHLTALIRPEKLDDVRTALADINVSGLTVTDVRGFGRQRGHKEIYRGVEYDVSFTPKTKIEIALPDNLVDTVIEAIQQSAKTDRIGDGKIFVIPLENAVRIRTGETGDSAL